MFKLLSSFISVFLLSISFVYGITEEPPMDYPPRQDKLDCTSKIAQFKLKRAQDILATLVPDPQSYQLMLSSNSTFGGEAVPPFVLADQPTIIVYQGSLSPNRSKDEIAFLLAHELGHLQLHHHEEMDTQMEKIFTGHPIQISGITYSIYFQKLQEQQADLFGLHLFQQAGYDSSFFTHTLKQIRMNPNIHFGSSKPFRKELSSLSMKNSHYNIKERFELLVQESQNF